MIIGRRKLRINHLFNTGIAFSLKYNYKISNQIPSHRAFNPFAQSIQSLHTGHSVPSHRAFNPFAQGIQSLHTGHSVPSHRAFNPFAQGIQSLHAGHSANSKSLHQSIKPLFLFGLPITKGDQILTSRRRNVIFILRRRNVYQIPTSEQ